MSSTAKPGDVTGETSMTSSMSAGTTPGGAATTTLAENSGDPGSSVVEATLTLTVDDPTITENETVAGAIIQGFAEVMGVEASHVMLSFQVSRRLHASTRGCSKSSFRQFSW